MEPSRPRPRTLRRDLPLDGGGSKGVSKRVWNAAYVGIGLEPRTEPGRPTTELQGAWCLKPYWGKPDVRNFREGGWKRDHGSRTEAHGESRGIATGPYRARASALPDSGSTQGNVSQTAAHRTRSRASVSIGLAGVRQVATFRRHTPEVGAV